MKVGLRWWAGALVCGALALPGWTLQNQSGSHPAGEAHGARSGAQSGAQGGVNQQVVDLLNTVNQGEIDEGQLMQDHAQDQGVKDYAKMLVSDHQNAENQLKDVSSKAGLTPGTDAALQQESSRLKARLSSAPGASADRTFLHAEVQDHTKVVHQLRRMAPRITDPGLKSYVQQLLPGLEAHLKQAHQLMRGGNATGTPAGRASHRYGTPPSR